MAVLLGQGNALAGSDEKAINQPLEDRPGYLERSGEILSRLKCAS
jgi:hypothetical protein